MHNRHFSAGCGGMVWACWRRALVDGLDVPPRMRKENNIISVGLLASRALIRFDLIYFDPIQC